MVAVHGRVDHASLGSPACQLGTDDDLRFLGCDDDVQAGVDRGRGREGSALRVTGGLQHRDQGKLNQNLRSLHDGDAACLDRLAGSGEVSA